MAFYSFYLQACTKYQISLFDSIIIDRIGLKMEKWESQVANIILILLILLALFHYALNIEFPLQLELLSS
jgi:hypothetical protein